MTHRLNRNGHRSHTPETSRSGWPLLRLPLFALLLAGPFYASLQAQSAPTETEMSQYSGLFEAVAKFSDTSIVKQRIAETSDIETRDRHHRSALLVAAYVGNHAAMRSLVAAGADPNAFDDERYDMVTIAAVANDLETMRLALELGNKPGNVTSPYDGTALIAAAHLGHVEVVQTLIEAGAPLNHVNNLGWTALIESIVLGDGAAKHTATLKALVDAGADVNRADGNGRSPLMLATQRGYDAMIKILTNAGAR